MGGARRRIGDSRPPVEQTSALESKPADGEIKTGDYRSLFIAVGEEVVILRAAHRRELERAVKQIHPAAVALWRKRLSIEKD